MDIKSILGLKNRQHSTADYCPDCGAPSPVGAERCGACVEGKA